MSRPDNDRPGPPASQQQPRRHPFTAGDRFSYISVTQGHLVVWTRDADGLWHASDEAMTGRGSATDGEVAEAMKGDDWSFSTAGESDG